MISPTLDRKNQPLQSCLAWLPIFLSVGFFIFYGALILMLPANQLSYDEPFRYFQARDLLHFKFSHFNYTHPILLSAIVAVFFSSDPVLPRLVLAFLFSIGLYFFFRIAESFSSRRGALYSTLIFGSANFTQFCVCRIYSESIFMPSVFAAILIAIQFTRKPKNSLLVWLSVCLSLIVLSRASGIPIVLTLGFYMLAKADSNQVRKKLFISFLPCLICFLITSWMGAGYYIKSQSIIHEFSTVTFRSYALFIFNSFWFTRSSDTLLLLPLFLMGVVYVIYKIKSREDAASIPLICAVVSMVTILAGVPTWVTFRHLFPTLGLMTIYVGPVLTKLEKKLTPSFSFIILFVVMFSALQGVPKILQPSDQEIFTKIPDQCQSVNQFNAPIGAVEIPYFSQPPYTDYTYEASIHGAQSADHLILEYIENSLVDVQVDGRSILHLVKKVPGAFRSRHVIQHIDLSGDHVLSISVAHGAQIGGLGQVLLCRGYPEILPKSFL